MVIANLVAYHFRCFAYTGRKSHFLSHLHILDILNDRIIVQVDVRKLECWANNGKEPFDDMLKWSCIVQHRR